MIERRPFGIIGLFESSEAVVAAARHLRELGFREIEAYTPFPVEGLDRIIRPGRRVWLPLLMFVSGVVGGLWGYFIQWWDEAWSYPLNVGGRPFNSWPAFMVSAVEIMLLLAVSGGFLGLLIVCRLPRLYHPIFNSAWIERASRDRFVLCIEARDPQFEPRLIRPVFERLGAERIEEVWE